MPPSQARWSKARVSSVTLRTVSWPVDHPRAVDDAAHAEDRDLRVVDDGGGAVDAEHAVVVHRERAAGEVRRGEAALAGRRRALRQPGRQVPGGQPVRVGHDRDDQAVVGLRGEAEVDPVGHDDLVALDAGVQLGVAAQAEDGEPGEQGKQADRPLGIGRVQRAPRLDQVGGVDVDPDGRLGDLPAGAGQLVGRRAPRAAQRDPPLTGLGCPGQPLAPAVRCRMARPAMAGRTSSRLTTPSGPVPVRWSGQGRRPWLPCARAARSPRPGRGRRRRGREACRCARARRRGAGAGGAAPAPGGAAGGATASRRGPAAERRAVPDQDAAAGFLAAVGLARVPAGTCRPSPAHGTRPARGSPPPARPP